MTITKEKLDQISKNFFAPVDMSTMVALVRAARDGLRARSHNEACVKLCGHLANCPGPSRPGTICMDCPRREMVDL